MRRGSRLTVRRWSGRVRHAGGGEPGIPPLPSSAGFPTKPRPKSPASKLPKAPAPTTSSASVVSFPTKVLEATLPDGDTRESVSKAHHSRVEEWSKKYGYERHRGWGTLAYEVAPTVTTAAFAIGSVASIGLLGLPTWIHTLELIAAFTSSQRLIARGVPCPVEGMRSLVGKVCLVTGGSSGMGTHVAAALLNAGATVITTYRTVPAAETRSRILSLVREDIREKMGGERNPSLVIWPLHLEDRSSILKLCNSVKKQFPNGLDLLVNNAGNMMGDEYTESNGIEHTIDVSFVGPYALTETLLPHIFRVGGRVVYVSSHSHRIATTRDEPQKIVSRTIGRTFAGTGDMWYHRYRTFSYAKFGNVCHAESLARRGVKVVTVNPGKVNTNLRRVVFPYLATRYYYPGVLWQLRTPEEGAQTIIYACVAPDEKLTWGGYYHNCGLLRYGKSQFVLPAADAACDWAASQCKVPVTKLHTFKKQ